jgi:3-phosphoshikimate 1-carboxyvinyltransferase
MSGHNPTNFRIAPGGSINGQISVPGDKSISHRALMLSAIAEGQSKITGFLAGEDTLATLNAFKSMGIMVDHNGQDEVIVNGGGLRGLSAPDAPLDLGNSGTSVRLLTGILAGQSFNTELTGDSSLIKRPMQRISEPLKLMHADITCSDDGTLPINICGGQTLRGIDYDLPVASAQLKSCLLLAGLYADGITCVHENTLTRDHTERMLSRFGYPVQINGSTVCITGGDILHACDIDVPGDISSAAFFIIGACISEGSDITLKKVGNNPTRNAVIDILQAMGADIRVYNEHDVSGEPVADIQIKSSQLNGIDIPIERVPVAIDEFPAIMIAAACSKGTTRLKGATELRMKESNRIMALSEGLRTLGINVETFDDGMVVEGGHFKGGTINSYGDHRIAMAFSMAGLVAENIIHILDSKNVETSFPGFAVVARGAGLKIEVDTNAR